jgi:SNF2 family DNA or RNA helicase
MLLHFEREYIKWTGKNLCVFENEDDLRTPFSCIVGSYAMMRRYHKHLLKYEWNALICDEIQHAKNSETLTSHVLWQLRKRVRHFYCFTGTPLQNTPREFFELVSLVYGKSIVAACEGCLLYRNPKFPSPFRVLLQALGVKLARLNQGPVIGVRKPKRLKELIGPLVESQPQANFIQECNMPVLDESIQNVELSEEEVYKYRKCSKVYRRKNDRLFLSGDLEDSNLSSSFNRMSELRQLLIADNGKLSSKSLKCIEDVCGLVQNEANRILVFSNFVERGVDILARELILRGVPCGVFTGVISRASRKKLVSSYLSGETRVVFLSPVGFEGLDMPGTTHICVLDPHFNPARRSQLVARSQRAQSGVKRVDVVHYIAKSQSVPAGTVDEVILRIAKRKQMINDIISQCVL